MKGRSSYQQSINVLRAIDEGLTPSEIKSREGLSRYSFQFVVNRLINTRLIEYQGDRLVVLNKGLRVLSFDGEKDWTEIGSATQIARPGSITS